MALSMAILFAIYYHILEPANFSSFSDTLRYFISALATVLAVVVSFNTLALRNHLNNMPTNMERLNSQLDKIANLLQPVFARNSGAASLPEHDDRGGKPALYYTDALEALMNDTRKKAESLAQNGQKTKSSDDNQDIYSKFMGQIDCTLEMYRRHKSAFFLVSISTTAFVQHMRFAPQFNKNKQTEDLFETAKRLHVMRNIAARIFIRNSLTKLSLEMLAFTIPIIAFAAIISAISNYGSYNTVFLRVLFAASMSTVLLPFILLFIRTMPVLQLIGGSSSIPFARQGQ